MSGPVRALRLHIDRRHITGVVLAGGRGSRMGGLDKGLQPFEGVPLALHALRRLQAQVGSVMISANRNLERYRTFGVPVWPDDASGYAGPLAGVACAMRHCATPYLATVPCDTPRFPGDVVERLRHALERDGAAMAVATIAQASRTGEPTTWRRQPVFCLLQTDLLPSLERHIAAGNQRVDGWITANQHVEVRFADFAAFANVNTLAQLQALEQSAIPSPVSDAPRAHPPPNADPPP